MIARSPLDDVLRVPYFAALRAEEQAEFARELRTHTYAARELVMVEGEPSRGFYLVRSGRVRIFRTGTDGREQILRLASSGDTFGEVPVFDGGPNPATVEALDHSEVVLVPIEAVRRLVARNPEVASALLLHFARRIRSFTDLVEQISLQTVQNRIARYLYLLAREEGIRTPEGLVVPRAITQQDLAALVGSVREVVSRTLKVMEEDRVIEIRRREFVIRDLAALGRLV
jgi:CRP/FNR family transcriptional regulator